MVIIMMSVGIVKIIIGESEKNKGEKSQLFQQRKKGKKINQIIQTMNQQGKNQSLLLL